MGRTGSSRRSGRSSSSAANNAKEESQTNSKKTTAKTSTKRRRSSRASLTSISSSCESVVSYADSSATTDSSASSQGKEPQQPQKIDHTTKNNQRSADAPPVGEPIGTLSASAAATTSSASATATAAAPIIGTGGCLKCGQDDDHANLMLCEGCNDEYHIYCLDPPLRAVPQGDWFCDKCKPQFRTDEANDGLELLVAALPPNFTSRFGEIVWAAGGVGFGWWPACIYDPRLTVGSARQLARKHLGKKHLVYFFECQDAPFSVLQNSKLCCWEQGLVDDFHIGKAARSAGKSRTLQFEHALQAAMVEHGKPVEIRLEWNHQEHDALPLATTNTTTTATTTAAIVQPTASSPAIVDSGRPTRKPPSSETLRSHHAEEPLRKKSKKRSGTTKTKSTSRSQVLLTPSPNRANFNSALMAMSPHHHDQAISANEIESSELYCTILLKKNKNLLEGTYQITGNNSHTDEDGNDESVTQKIGFIKLQSRLLATFADARNAIESDIDHVCLPSQYLSPVAKDDVEQQQHPNNNNNIMIQWRFYVPSMGPVSLKQESNLGSMYAFLKGTTTDPRIGEGNLRNPLKIIIAQYTGTTPTASPRHPSSTTISLTHPPEKKVN